MLRHQEQLRFFLFLSWRVFDQIFYYFYSYFAFFLLRFDGDGGNILVFSKFLPFLFVSFTGSFRCILEQGLVKFWRWILKMDGIWLEEVVWFWFSSLGFVFVQNLHFKVGSRESRGHFLLGFHFPSHLTLCPFHLQPYHHTNPPSFPLFTTVLNGLMRPSQLARLNWMVSLHTNGLSGLRLPWGRGVLWSRRVLARRDA